MLANTVEAVCWGALWCPRMSDHRLYFSSNGLVAGTLRGRGAKD